MNNIGKELGINKEEDIGKGIDKDIERDIDKDKDYKEKEKEKRKEKEKEREKDSDMEEDNKDKITLTTDLRDNIIQLARTKGYISIISGLLGITKDNLLRWLNEDESFSRDFLFARAQLLDELRDKMIAASHDKKSSDWRQYYQQLQTLEREFSAQKWLTERNTSPQQQINIIISQQDAEEAKEIAEKIIGNVPSDDKLIGKSKVRLLSGEKKA